MDGANFVAGFDQVGIGVEHLLHFFEVAFFDGVLKVFALGEERGTRAGLSWRGTGVGFEHPPQEAAEGAEEERDDEDGECAIASVLIWVS